MFPNCSWCLMKYFYKIDCIPVNKSNHVQHILLNTTQNLIFQETQTQKVPWMRKRGLILCLYSKRRKEASNKPPTGERVGEVFANQFS